MTGSRRARTGAQGLRGIIASLAVLAGTLTMAALTVAPAPSAAATQTSSGSVAVGTSHSCGVTMAGGVKCWGSNANGQLGNGTTTASTAPVNVTGLTTGVASVAVGDNHSCAVTKAGAVRCWGANNNGQLGNSSTTPSSTPVTVSGLSSGAALVSVGSSFSCAVTTTGGVKCWGVNTNGQLGNASTATSTFPVNVTGLTSGAASVSAGGTHACAVTTSGGAKCWGSNGSGRLGNGSTTQSTTPVDVTGLTSGAASVSAGSDASCAVTTSGGAKCWGTNNSGRLGNGSTTQSTTPVDVSGLATGVDSIDMGGFHACAVTTVGAVRCWGLNSDGQLGDGSTTTSLVPVPVTGLVTDAASISVGLVHACARTTAGAMKCWGRNDVGQLGHTATVRSPTPLDVTGLTAGVTSIASGINHSCAVTTSGGAKCWGSNNNGQLGNGSTVASATPVDVTGLTSGVAAVAAGGTASCAVTVGGGAKCWGQNGPGQLGNGTNTTSSTPVNVVGLSTGVAKISVGLLHACAVTTAGGVKCWGLNDNGQLGNGSFATSNVPVDVVGLTSGVASVSAGNYHTCAVTTAGGVKCWGQNFAGQLGNGTNAGSSTPVNVTGLASGVASVASGDTFSCAVTNAGGAKCWGQNFSGQLGTGTTTSTITPVDVTGLTSGVAAVAVGTTNGNGSSCAVTTTGAVRCWGFSYQSTPAVAAGLTSGAVSVSVGSGVSCVLTTDGGAKCWGDNSSGQLGSVAAPYVPTEVSGGFTFGPPVAPTISGSRSPAANGNGWNNEPVTVTFTCSSAALASCTAPVTVNTDGADRSVTGTVTDTAAQTATATVSGINIDRVAPTLAGVATSSPNDAGWFRAPVTMAWTCGDDRSGIAAGACPESSTTVGEGSTVSVSASVTDRAGNQATSSSQSVKIDLTNPSTGASSPPTWTNTDVTLALTATDALSGVAKTEYQVDGGAVQAGTAPQVVGAGFHTVTYWSTDRAGNVEPAQSVTVRIDVQAPSITASVSPAPNSAGWNNGPVTVTFDCGDSDGGSGVTSCTAPQTLEDEIDTTVTGTVSDAAGNTASVQQPVRIDTTPPTVTASVPAANANGWFNEPVQVPFTCQDSGGSGVAVCPAPVVFAGEGANQPVAGEATDAAGNAGSASGATVSLDSTPPTIDGAALQTANADGGYFGDVVVHWTCDDALSGVVACPADVTVSGEGVHVVSGSVTDRAGSTSTAEVTVQINHDPSTDPGTVHGTITDASNAATVAGATVTLRTTANAIVATTTTDANGSYLFPAVADGTYKLYASRNGAYLGAYRAGTFTVSHGTATTADLALVPTPVLSGTVRDATGAPVAGATVRVLPASLVAVSDATGAYRVTGLQPGAVTVRVLATGFVQPADVAMTITGSRTHDVSLVGARPGHGVKGTVRARTTGAPLSGAVVRVWLKGATTYTRTVTTGTDGRYSFPTLTEGTYEIDVVRVDYQVRWFGDVLSRSSALPVPVTTGCTTTPDPSWGDPCALPADIRMG